MSTSPIGSSSSSATPSPLTSSQFSSGASLSTSGSALQITGLASGLDTNAIIQALMASEEQPVTNLQNQQTGLTALNSQLSSIQSSLQQLAADAQALGSPTLFTSTQSVTSTDPTTVTATATGSSGAVVGGYQVAVSQLATAAQRTFTFTTPSSADTITIDNQPVTLAAGAHAQDLVNAINSNSNLDVWATATNSGTVVLSDRSTGYNSTYIQVSDPGGTLFEQTSLAQAGQNAEYTINGNAGSSASNTLTSAIPGVTLSLSGVTTGGPAVTVNVTPPGPNTQSVQTAVQTFVTQYNSVLSQVQTQLSQQPTSSDPTQGTLYADPELEDLLTNMRQAMYAAGSGLPTGMASMLDIGVSTGASTGSATPSQSAIEGNLVIDTATLTSALTSNPNGVQQVMASWSQSFSSLVNDEAGPGGAIDERVQGDSSQISDLGNQIDNMQAILADKQNQLTQQFAQLEGVLSQNQSQSSWLTSQIASLPTP